MTQPFNLFKPNFYKLSTAAVFMSTLAITGCQTFAEMNNSIPHTEHSSSSISETTNTDQQSLKDDAIRIQRALANGDYASIADDIHPNRGVRFSMYAYIRPESDKVFSPVQYLQYLRESNIRFTWGAKDGTGDPLVIPLPEYLQTWVNANTFNDGAKITINESQVNGNSINNLNEIYQNSDFVEFYSAGSEQYGGMDWRGMRLVFDEYQGKRYLVAIISDQWTI